MKSKRYFLRSWVSFLIMSAFLLALPAKSDFGLEKNKSQISQKAEKQKDKPVAEKNSSETQLKITSPETIVPFTGIDLGQVIVFDFKLTFPKVLPEIIYGFQKPLFLLSYFENTFCHHIAINAP
ncbi:MAG: hypothetical protein H7Y04_12810 [Verrucomicrobia bacterium]|nr:hypothetical protein [Cytophagales bacterium]